MTTRRVRALALTGLILLVSVGFPSAAHAHATVVSSNPSEGTVVDTLPAEVTITFDENIATPAFVSVIASDGTNLAEGSPTILDATVTQPVRSSTATGTYTLSYRVVSADSHPLSGSLTFGVGRGTSLPKSTQSASSTEANTASDNSSSSNTMLYVWLVIGVAVALFLGAVLFATSGSESEEPSEPRGP